MALTPLMRTPVATPPHDVRSLSSLVGYVGLAPPPHSFLIDASHARTCTAPATPCPEPHAVEAAVPTVPAVKAEQPAAVAWLTPEGTLDESMALDVLLTHLVENKANQQFFKQYAELLCNDCFDEEAMSEHPFYAPQDPYYIAMDLRNNAGIDTGNVDIIDTLRDCRKSFIEQKTTWIEAAMDDVCNGIHDLATQPSQDISEGYSKMRERIDTFFIDEAYGLMKDSIRTEFAEVSDSE